jgi:hypothetical protein
MRSCSLSVLVDATAKQATSVHPDPLMLANERLIGGWIRRLQSKRSVPGDARCRARQSTCRTCSKWPRRTISSQSKHSERTVRIQRFAWAFALGACTGVSSTSAPCERNTSSKVRQNFASRSRSKKRTRRPARRTPAAGSLPAGPPKRRRGWRSPRRSGRPALARPALLGRARTLPSRNSEASSISRTSYSTRRRPRGIAWLLATQIRVVPERNTFVGKALLLCSLSKRAVPASHFELWPTGSISPEVNSCVYVPENRYSPAQYGPTVVCPEAIVHRPEIWTTRPPWWRD